MPNERKDAALAKALEAKRKESQLGRQVAEIDGAACELAKRRETVVARMAELREIQLSALGEALEAETEAEAAAKPAPARDAEETGSRLATALEAMMARGISVPKS